MDAGPILKVFEAHMTAEGILGRVWCTPGSNPWASGRIRVQWLPAFGSRGLRGYLQTGVPSAPAQEEYSRVPVRGLHV